MCYNRKREYTIQYKEDRTIADILDKSDRFETFVLLIDAIHKGISRVKQDIVADSSIKSVHTMWLYELLKHSDGLTATEIAAKSKIDRSLVSRELSTLAKGGYIEIESTGRKRSYNSRITLTEEGARIANRIAEIAYKAQEAVGQDVTKEDLVVFYTTLEKFYVNLEKLTEK